MPMIVVMVVVMPVMPIRVVIICVGRIVAGIRPVYAGTHCQVTCDGIDSGMVSPPHFDHEKLDVYQLESLKSKIDCK